jgi:hypothetical protein
VSLFAQFRFFIILLSLFATVVVFADDEVYLNEKHEICLDEDDYVQDEVTENHFECEADEREGSVTDDCIVIDREPFISFLDTPQTLISSNIESLATTLDEFFSNEKTYYESSGSYLRLTYNTISYEGGRVDTTSDINFKLRLPNTEKKLMFVVETESDQLSDAAKQTIKTTATEKKGEKQYIAGVQAIIAKKEHWRLKPITGIKTGATFEPFFKLYMDWNNNIGKWDLHWNETPHWYDSTGWGLDSLFEINRKITDKVIFRSSSFAQWTKTKDYFELGEVLSVFHTLSEKGAILYQAGVYGTSEPTILTTHYLLSIRYREKVYKDYLFFELTPQISYQKINNFDPEYSVLFKIEMVFNE